MCFVIFFGSSSTTQTLVSVCKVLIPKLFLKNLMFVLKQPRASIHLLRLEGKTYFLKTEGTLAPK